MPDESLAGHCSIQAAAHLRVQVGTGRVNGVRPKGNAHCRRRASRRGCGLSATERRRVARLEPAPLLGTTRMDRGSRSGRGHNGEPAVRRLIRALLALSLFGATASAQGGTQRGFPHERHERLFPLCESCHAGISTGDAATSMPSEASCRECHNGTDERVVTWRRTEREPGLLRFSHASHGREVDSTGRACATCHGPGAPSRMIVQRAAPPTCLGCHTHRAPDHLADDNRCAVCHVPLTTAVSLTAEHIATLPRPPSHQRSDFTGAPGQRHPSRPQLCYLPRARVLRPVPRERQRRTDHCCAAA
jgi:predicted CXXCH cytochrome family protein